MNNSQTVRKRREAGAVRIRLNSSVAQGAPQLQPAGGAREDEMFKEITSKLSRQSPQSNPKPSKSTRVGPPLPEPKTSLTLTRAVAQISMVTVAIFVGMTYGQLPCLAFILFFCLPVAAHLWSDTERRQR